MRSGRPFDKIKVEEESLRRFTILDDGVHPRASGWIFILKKGNDTGSLRGKVVSGLIRFRSGSFVPNDKSAGKVISAQSFG